MINVEKLKAAISELAPQYDLKLAVLFGSQARGTTHKDSDVDIAVQGTHGVVDFSKMIEIFSQSKICLNFTKNSGILWKELAYIFVRRRMHDRKIVWNTPSRIADTIKAFPAAMWNNQIKGRNFEIPGCGSFCLTEYADDLESYYEIGEEIECFSTVKEAPEKIRYYLSHEEAREAIAKAGYERTLREHTYEKRFQEIFHRMGLGPKIV